MQINLFSSLPPPLLRFPSFFPPRGPSTPSLHPPFSPSSSPFLSASFTFANFPALSYLEVGAERRRRSWLACCFRHWFNLDPTPTAITRSVCHEKGKTKQNSKAEKTLCSVCPAAELKFSLHPSLLSAFHLCLSSNSRSHRVVPLPWLS